MKQNDNELFETKMSKCRYYLPNINTKSPNLKVTHRCKLHDENITEDICETCPNFKSHFIEYPIQVDKIVTDEFRDGFDLYANKVGSFVEVRPCGDEYGKKTYVGILLGEQPMGARVTYNESNRQIRVSSNMNPAIFVPTLKKIIYGCESWWRVIENPNEIQNISEDDINNTWYVQLAKSMTNQNKNES